MNRLGLLHPASGRVNLYHFVTISDESEDTRSRDVASLPLIIYPR